MAELSQGVVNDIPGLEWIKGWKITPKNSCQGFALSLGWYLRTDLSWRVVYWPHQHFNFSIHTVDDPEESWVKRSAGMARIITSLKDFGSDVSVTLQHWLPRCNEFCKDLHKVQRPSASCADSSSVQSLEWVPAVQGPRIALRSPTLWANPCLSLRLACGPELHSFTHWLSHILCHRTGPATATCCRLHHGVISVVRSSAWAVLTALALKPQMVT